MQNQTKVEDYLAFSSQPVRNPSSRSLLSHDKERLPLDTWNQAGVHQHVFENNFSTFRDLPERISSEHVHRNREAVPGDTQVKTSLTKLRHNSNAGVCYKADDYEF